MLSTIINKQTQFYMGLELMFGNPGFWLQWVGFQTGQWQSPAGHCPVGMHTSWPESDNRRCQARACCRGRRQRTLEIQ